jgi:formate dehydrogenase (coenzyme F420) beta subunit
VTRTEAIRTRARSLLETGAVARVIGYEVDGRGRTRPAFVERADDVGRLAWNAACTHNLAVYLPRLLRPGPRGETPARVAVLVKPCDSRAVNVQIAEGQVRREQVHLIGVACPGILEGAGRAGIGVEVEEPPAGARLQPRCLRCAERLPVVCDERVGEPPPESGLPTASWGDDLAALTALEPAGRLEHFLQAFDRCVRCYACRQACPLCNCPTCLFERDDSLYVGIGIRLDEKRTFHLGRALHLAGRCVGCDECERVCPVGLPLSLLNRQLAREVEARFGFRPGLAAVPGPLVTPLGQEAAA